MTFETDAVNDFLKSREQTMSKLTEMAAFFLKEQKVKQKKFKISAAQAHIKVEKKQEYTIPYVSLR
jgi:hypothetical protein